MNRKDRRASGIKKGTPDKRVILEALKTLQELEKKGLKEDAKILRAKILAYDPDNAGILLDEGHAFFVDENFEEAEKRYERILKNDPKHPNALTLMAQLRMAQSRKEEALRYAEKSVRYHPAASSWALLSNVYRETGDLEKARECAETALKLDPKYVPALYSLGTLKKATEDSLQRLKGIADTQLTLNDKISLEFTLGRACMELGKTDEAFKHFADGNLLRRATYKWDVATFEQYVDYIIELFDEKAVQSRRGLGSNKSSSPIFIVGMPRSGSTLTDQILSSHPVVGSVGESPFFARTLPIYPNERLPKAFREGKAPSISKRLLDGLDGTVMDDIAAKYLQQTAPFAHGAEKIVDKQLFNFLFIGVMRLALPEAKIIHCTRDPVDIGLSIWQLMFDGEIPWAFDLQEIGRYYIAYKRLMAHWNKVFPGEIFEANYEAMVADQETQSRKLLEFCGLPWDDRVLNFHESERSVKTASSVQVRQPLYTGSVKKWKKYEQYLQPLIQTLEKGGAL